MLRGKKRKGRLKAPVYACVGTHDYLRGEPRAKKFYQDAGIHLLIDNHSVVPLAQTSSNAVDWHASYLFYHRVLQ